MPPKSPFLVQTAHPATFLERGVAVPFTSPVLAGTRVRPGARAGPELIIPNPSGARGAYILPWSSLAEFCQPTVHDTQLTRKVAALRVVTPTSIREVARRVAAEGLAGQDAQRAAAAAVNSDQQAKLSTNFGLLLLLVRQAEPVGDAALAAERKQPDHLQARAKRAIARVAPRLGMRPDVVADTLEELAAVLAPIGINGDTLTASQPGKLEDLRILQTELASWDGHASEEEAALAALVARLAAITVRGADRALAEARAEIEDLPGLIARWHAGGGTLAPLFARPEWLLDGWEQVCLLWRADSSDAGRRRALAEISHMVPVLPTEAGHWTGVEVEASELPRLRRTVLLGEDWRTGVALMDLILRNEQFRALGA